MKPGWWCQRQNANPRSIAEKAIKEMKFTACACCLRSINRLKRGFGGDYMAP